MTEKYPLKDNQGRAFKNDRKRDNKDASFTGKLRLVDENGEETNFFLDLWINAKNEDHTDAIIDAIKYIGARVKKMRPKGESTGPTFDSRSNQGDMGYSRDTPPRPARDIFADEKAKAASAQGDKVPGPRTFGNDIDDSIPF